MADTGGAEGSGRPEMLVRTTDKWTLTVREVCQTVWQINMTDLDLTACITTNFSDYPITNWFYVRVSKDTSEECPRLVVQVFKCGKVARELNERLLLKFNPSVVLYDEEDEQEAVQLGANSKAVVVMSKEWQQRFLKDGVLKMACSVRALHPQEAGTLLSWLVVEKKKALFKDLWDDSYDGDLEVNFNKPGYHIRAHKAVLSARSPVFKRLINQDHEIKLPLDQGECAAFLKFVYLGHCESEYFTKDMLTVAHQFKLNGLKRKVEHHLANSLKRKNVEDYLRLSYEVNAKRLRKACFKKLEVLLKKAKPNVGTKEPEELMESTYIKRNQLMDDIKESPVWEHSTSC